MMKEKTFRFAVMGAGHIARKFCDAVALVDGAEVCAVASKSMDRARALCDEKGIPAAYDDYERLLTQEKPDCAYISTTCDAHRDLTMLCCSHGVGVLCEKAMFTNLNDAARCFEYAVRQGVFTMEALWSRFLPANLQARAWVREGRIGRPVAAEMGIGFAADPSPENRYFSPALGGGAANDLTIYGLQILSFTLDRPIAEAYAVAVPAPTGVDGTSIVALRLGDDVPAAVRSSLMASVDEKLVVYGTAGKIVVPHAHYASEAVLLRPDGTEAARFRDETTVNGFTYEIAETMRCVRAGLTESPEVPHAATLACAGVFDLIKKSMK